MELKELMTAFAETLGIDGMKVDVFHAAEADTVMVYGEIGRPPARP